MIRIISIILVFFSVTGYLFSQEIELTVYNQNFALVKEKRSLEIEKGIKKLDFSDVPVLIEPESVRFKSLTAPDGCRVLEQNFEYDLISREKLLEKYLGREIEFEKHINDKREIIKGTLLSISGGLILKVDDKILLNPEGEAILSKLPEGLIIKPTLSWLLENEKPGKHNIEIDYLTNGINWNADYVVVTDKEDKKIDLTGWVTINNRSGAVYNDAKLKLIAGDVNRISPSNYGAADGLMESKRFAMKAPAAQFQEKSFFEYHMYTLSRRTTIKDKETKQIEFVKGNEVAVNKIFTYDGSRIPFYGYQQWYRTNRDIYGESSKKVSVMLEFKNSKDNNIGMALPKGKIKVYKQDTDGGLEFVGEDEIDHTPKDEKIRIFLGNAFDITAEKTQTDFKTGNDWCEETFKITIRNHKDEQVAVNVVEHLYRWSNWKITQKSADFEKADSKTIEFKTIIPKNGESNITYTVKYWW